MRGMEATKTHQAGERTLYPFQVTMTLSQNYIGADSLWGHWTEPREVTEHFISAASRAKHIERLRNHCNYRISNVQFSTLA